MQVHKKGTIVKSHIKKSNLKGSRMGHLLNFLFGV